MDSITPADSVVEPVVIDDITVEQVPEPIELQDDVREDPIMCIDDDDDECNQVNESTPKRTTRNSRKRNATVRSNSWQGQSFYFMRIE